MVRLTGRVLYKQQQQQQQQILLKIGNYITFPPASSL